MIDFFNNHSNTLRKGQYTYHAVKLKVVRSNKIVSHPPKMHTNFVPQIGKINFTSNRRNFTNFIQNTKYAGESLWKCHLWRFCANDYD